MDICEALAAMKGRERLGNLTVNQWQEGWLTHHAILVDDKLVSWKVSMFGERLSSES